MQLFFVSSILRVDDIELTCAPIFCRYFDFFEEAFNYIAAKGYSRMPKAEEGEWMDLMVSVDLFAGEGAGQFVLGSI